MAEPLKKYNVPALEKAIAIIETLSLQEEPLGVSELCKQLDIPKTSVFFILSTLEQHEYITKTEDGKYKLGTKFISLGLSVLNKMNIVELARPFLQELLEETGFTVHLAVLNDGQAMYVDKLESQSFVKFSTYIGQRQPLHASGVGKALAAYLAPEELEQIAAVQGLQEKTKNTITDLEQLKAALDIVRAQGYALEDEEGEHGIRCIGAPIFDDRGRLKASISITALRTDLPVHDILVVGEKVKQTARNISKRLGYTFSEE
ncbi:HTH-type transcriptional repressor AllR [Paenibacillus allorhizosphaerae]|uniref:HTH-type transcriptional repressor AllR n=2 Tax=Paenibacillus allorhizosphaerae TaxID=2849866 RepID=A0ABN7TSU2_9BACL|nr:IclR family transcriptional regulator [Paenibacillus allorhizosphaerae]CAG7654389.1 HTH-type transcriptional repressor AllR [Paenibacillus allorhizosphaerae]